MIDDIAKAGACLVIQYNHNGKWYYKMTFPNQILEKSDQYLLSSTEASSKLLQNDLTVMNKLYPQKIDEGTTLNKVYVEDDKLVYEILLDPRYFDLSSISEADKEQMKNGIKEELSSDRDPTTKKFAKILLTLNMELRYRYKCKKSTVDIIFRPSELRPLLR